MSKRFRLLLAGTLAIIGMAASASSSLGATIQVLQPVPTLGTATSTAQGLTFSGTVVSCTQRLNFQLLRNLITANIGDLINIANLGDIVFTCASGTSVIGLNRLLVSGSQGPAVIGRLDAVGAAGLPSTADFTVLNVQVQITSPIDCLLRGSIRVRLNSNGSFSLTGGALVATGGRSPSCIAGIPATLGTASYTTTPLLPIRVS